MGYLRNVIDDLVEKRLWPVALGLVVLLIAVPLVFGAGGGDDAADDAPIAAPSTGAPEAVPGGLTAAIRQQAPSTKRRDRTGTTRDPFKVLYGSKGGGKDAAAAAASDTSKQVAAAVAKAAAAAQGSGGTPSSTPSTAPRTPNPPPNNGNGAPAPGKGEVQVVTGAADVRFALEGTKGRLRKNMDRFTLLPSESRQYVQFLGVLSDFKTTVFLLAGNATATTTKGKCTPAVGKCESIELKEDETAKVVVSLNDGTTQVWDLEVEDVYTRVVTTEAPRTTAKKSAVARQRAAREARNARTGRKVLQAAREIARAMGKVTQADAYRWDSDRQALRRQNAKAIVRAAQARR